MLLFATLIAVSACGDYPLAPFEREQLARAQAKWSDKGSVNYSIEARIVCFCPPHLAQWTTLTVRNGVVIAADPVESLPDGITPDLTGWLTVDEEFERLANPPDILEDINVRFDATFGYPTYISADCGPNVADCGSVHEMRNFRFAPATPAIRR